MLKIDDAALIKQAEKARKYLCSEYKKTADKKFLKNSKPVFPFPLDKDVIKDLDSLLAEDETEISYSKAKELNELWTTLLKKSIQCLRFFDTREPFQQDDYDLEENSSRIEAYGIDSLKKYQDHYAAFESMLYGSSAHYRDHVFHSVRVWLIGVYVLTKEINKNEPLIKKLVLDGGAKDVGSINHFEWLSMWTIAALCHDLGYPLEKAGVILNETKKMMSEFVPKPNVSDNFTFTGIQDVFNDHILKFMSTKLHREKLCEDGRPRQRLALRQRHLRKTVYSGRVQQKYYFKYAKSLEKSKHGIISAVIAFKLLLFFLEADFNLNSDSYRYSKEDARQFYIRREVLRAMASHTCEDIFNVQIQTLPALLFICDELQGWGRKSWGDLYKGAQLPKPELSIDSFDTGKVKIIETIEMESISKIKDIAEEVVRRFFKGEYSSYKKTFRDGPGTTENPSAAKREFDFEKKITIKFPSKDAELKKLVVEYEIPRNEQEQEEFRIRVNTKTKRNELKKEIDGLLHSDKLKFLPLK